MIKDRPSFEAAQSVTVCAFAFQRFPSEVAIKYKFKERVSPSFRRQLVSQLPTGLVSFCLQISPSRVDYYSTPFIVEKGARYIYSEREYTLYSHLVHSTLSSCPSVHLSMSNNIVIIGGKSISAFHRSFPELITSSLRSGNFPRERSGAPYTRNTSNHSHRRSRLLLLADRSTPSGSRSRWAFQRSFQSRFLT